MLYSFTGGADGMSPASALAIDSAGNLYGTTEWGGLGYPGYGTVFELKHSGSTWGLTTLWSFEGGGYDGTEPGAVVFGPDGSLYGTTSQGAEGNCVWGNGGCGTIFKLQPSATACETALCPWTETVLYRFTGGSDGGNPSSPPLFDQSGNIYSTTLGGGTSWCHGGCGVIYELTPSGGGWTETVLFSPQSVDEGYWPGGVIFDRSGNLDGIFLEGGPYGYGTIYQLSRFGSSWTEQTLHGFTNGIDEQNPTSGLVLDPSGNLYGTTLGGRTGMVLGGGTLYELTPGNGGWTFHTLYAFPGPTGGGPDATLIMDAAGNLYGTASHNGAYGHGSVFKLARSDGGWTYTSLHDFTGGGDGCCPASSLAFAANGNLYGAAFGGAYGNGVVFEITP